MEEEQKQQMLGKHRFRLLGEAEVKEMEHVWRMEGELLGPLEGSRAYKHLCFRPSGESID